MKTLSIALAVSLASGTAASLLTRTLLDQVRTGYNNNKGALNLSRMLELSDECIAANQELGLDPLLISASQDALSSCPNAMMMTLDSLTIDYSVCPASVLDNLEEACDAAGGKACYLLCTNGHQSKSLTNLPVFTSNHRANHPSPKNRYGLQR
jgi:hypothetical protein